MRDTGGIGGSWEKFIKRSTYREPDSVLPPSKMGSMVTAVLKNTYIWIFGLI